MIEWLPLIKRYGNSIASGLMHLKMAFVRHVLLRSLINATANPDKSQARVLRRILKKNRNTEFGKLYGFSSIFDADEFVKRVPLHGYEELRLYIERQIATGKHSIVSEKPVIYAQTSGTTGRPKYIPILESTLDSYKRAQRIFSYLQHREVPGIFSGKILAVVSPAIEGHLSDGAPYGSMSGLVYQNMPAAILAKYVLPPTSFEIEDYESKYRLITAFALSEKNISCLATANPSTLIKIGEIIRQHLDTLIDFVATGNIDVLGVTLSAEERTQIAMYYSPNPDRATDLRRIKAGNKDIRFCDMWPAIMAVVTWTSGNCKLLIPQLQKQLSSATKIIEMGYLSSEFRGTITMDFSQNLGVPTIQDNFFEFAEVDSWDGGSQNTLLLSQLEQGKHYYIIVTAPHGLYRYFINDIVEVTGRFHETPTIAFVQKGRGITNLTGEKLYESQLIAAVQKVSNAHGIQLEFFMMLADQDTLSYLLYVESKNSFIGQDFAKDLNACLGDLNIEYASKSQSGRIKLTGVAQLRTGTSEAYKAACIKSGQREGQFKIVKLQYRKDVPFSFDEHLAS